ncbi:MAG TPA: discoidin domain-containing protein [Kiritimatiellia bacterium]|nr:discoidin domain-containing protein [Kiritimatiellia bacterium]
MTFKDRVTKTIGASAVLALATVRIGLTEEPIIIAPVNAAARTTWDGTSQGQPRFVSPQYLIDGSGLTGTGRNAMHNCANASNLFWHSGWNAVTNGWLEFDLGATYRVTNALIWQLAQESMTTRGLRSFSILTAGTDKAYALLSASNQLSQATKNVSVPVQIVPLIADNVRWIRFDIHESWGDSAIVGLSEVRFEVYPVPQVPQEPQVRIMSPIAATASTTWDGTASGQANFVSPTYMIDDSGLSGIGRDAVHLPNNGGGLFWHSNTGIIVSNQWVEFDLGMTCDLTNALIWQLAQKTLTTRGVKDFTILTAGEDRIFVEYATGHLNQAAGTTNEPIQVVPLYVHGVRYVRFNIQSNWGGGSIVGLSEVKFEVLRVHPATNALTLAYVEASASTTYQRSGFVSPSYLVDDVGLIGTGRDALHVDRDAGGLFWHSQTNVVLSDQWIEFDLGAPYDLQSVLLWQLAQTNLTARGIKAYSIQTAGTNRVFTTIAASNVLRRASRTLLEPVQYVPLTATETRYVRLDIHSNWGATDVVGLSAVKFEVAPPPDIDKSVWRTPRVVQSSSASDTNPVSRLIDDSGIEGTGLAATHTNGLGQSSMWLSGFGVITNEWVEFDLGREVDLDAVVIWQYNQTVLPDMSSASGCLKRGVRGTRIYLAGTDHAYSEHGFFGLPIGSGSTDEPAHLIKLDVDRVRYVKLAICSNWGDPCYVGLGEVKLLHTYCAGTLLKIR